MPARPRRCPAPAAGHRHIKDRPSAGSLRLTAAKSRVSGRSCPEDRGKHAHPCSQAEAERDHNSHSAQRGQGNPHTNEYRRSAPLLRSWHIVLLLKACELSVRSPSHASRLPRLRGRNQCDGSFGGEQKKSECLLQVQADRGIGVAEITDGDVLTDV